MNERQKRYRGKLKASGGSLKTIQMKQQSYARLKEKPGTFDKNITTLLDKCECNTSDCDGIDEWQTIPLSDAIALSKCIRYEFAPGGSEYDSGFFDPIKYTTVDAFHQMLEVKVNAWVDFEYKSGYIEKTTEVFAEYLDLIKPMIKAISDVDPLYDPNSCTLDPTRELFAYSLVYRDVITAQPATINDVLSFMMGLDLRVSSVEELICEAIYYDKYDILAAISLCNDSYGQNRYQWLMEQRRASLGEVDLKFLDWSPPFLWSFQKYQLNADTKSLRLDIFFE